MSEEPLHVQVARALGLEVTNEHERDEAPHGYSACVKCGQLANWDAELVGSCVPRYDTDWAATGPLIERYYISLTGNRAHWLAFTPEANPLEVLGGGEGPTPLIAVCRLILALSAAGKGVTVIRWPPP